MIFVNCNCVHSTITQVKTITGIIVFSNLYFINHGNNLVYSIQFCTSLNWGYRSWPLQSLHSSRYFRGHCWSCPIMCLAIRIMVCFLRFNITCFIYEIILRVWIMIFEWYLVHSLVYNCLWLGYTSVCFIAITVLPCWLDSVMLDKIFLSFFSAGERPCFNFQGHTPLGRK